MIELVAACLLLATESVPPPPAAAPPQDAQVESPAPVPAPPAAGTAPAHDASPAAAGAAAAPPAPCDESGAGAQPETCPVPAEALAPVGAVPTGDGPRPMRLTLSLGLGRAFPGGAIAKDRPMNDLTSPMGSLRLDAGFRIRPKLIVALVLDLSGGGTPGATLRADCTAADVDCAVASSRMSVDARYVFTPLARRTWWAGAGLGAEGTGLVPRGGGTRSDFMPTYSGGLFPRLSGGWDRRVNPYFGWGFYAGISFGGFSEVAMGESAQGSSIPGDSAGHSWLDLGVRIVAFP